MTAVLGGSSGSRTTKASTTTAGTPETNLVDTGGSHVAAAADRVRSKLGPDATVTDPATTRTVVGSSLTALDPAGLTPDLVAVGGITVTALLLVSALTVRTARRPAISVLREL